MKPIVRKKNLGPLSFLLPLVAVQSAFAAVVPFVDGLSLGSSGEVVLYPWTAASSRTGIAWENHSGGFIFYSPVSESVPGAKDSGFSFFGTPFSIVLGADYEGDTGTFDVWEAGSYWDTLSYSPVFRIDTAADTAAFKNLNVSITNGSLSVTGGLNLTGASGNAISVNGSPIFSIDSTGAVSYASGKPVAITSTSASSSSVTGALTVSGGVGVAKDSHINGLRLGRGAGDIYTNTALGGNALNGPNVGNNQVAVGYNALVMNSSGYSNSALGAYALCTNTTGIGNTAIGMGSIYSMSSGTHNTAIGHQALHLGAAMNYNTAVGTSSLYKNRVDNNSAFGVNSLYENTTGSNNAGLGNSALYGNVNGWNNLGVGNMAGYSNVSGSGNVFVGASAGRYQASGTTPLQTAGESVYIGYQSRGYSNSDSNSIVIGANAVGEGANTTVIGNNATVKTRLYGNTEVSSLAAPSGTAALVVKGKVIMETAQGDISMGIYE